MTIGMKAASAIGLSLAFAASCGGSGRGDRVDPIAPPAPPTNLETVIATVDANVHHQTLVGFGGAVAWYAGYLSGRSVAGDDIYDVLFRDLGLDILRIGNWYQNQRATGTTTDTPFSDTDVSSVVANATAALGHAPIVLMAAWSPPAYLKSNGRTKGSQGTLLQQDGAYSYDAFASWWLRSLDAYAMNGVTPDYISIQNEPDFYNAGWETCKLDPVEGPSAAGYGPALDAVYRAIQSSASLSHKPQIIGPERSGIEGGTLEAYLTKLDMNQIAGVAHHLYNGGNSTTNPAPESFNSAMANVVNAAAGKPLFMTEFSPGAPTIVDTAWLIHQALTVESVSAYVYWDLIWPPSTSSHPLMTVPSPSSFAPPDKGYTINDAYYAVKHFAKWTDPGWMRVDASSTNAEIKISAFQSPEGTNLTVVLLNTDTIDHAVKLEPGDGPFTSAVVYRTSGTSERAAEVPLGDDRLLSMPARSIATVTWSP
jgi:glucuronoarabinoxylan endo-1,4-beta-xylanase